MPLDASVGCHRHRGFGFVTFKESKGVEASQLHHFRSIFAMPLGLADALDLGSHKIFHLDFSREVIEAIK